MEDIKIYDAINFYSPDDYDYSEDDNRKEVLEYNTEE